MKKVIAIAAVATLWSGLVSVGICEAGPKEMPSKGTWSGVIYSAGLCPDGRPLLVNVASGFGTHTGASTYVSVSCLNYPSPTSEGWAIVTAANGDKLYLRIAAESDSSSGTWTETETTLGGTGRFEGASGLTISSGTFLPPEGKDLFPWDTEEIPPLWEEPTFWEGTGVGTLIYDED
jgi:hypothetical protein